MDRRHRGHTPQSLFWSGHAADDPELFDMVKNYIVESSTIIDPVNFFRSIIKWAKEAPGKIERDIHHVFSLWRDSVEEKLKTERGDYKMEDIEHTQHHNTCPICGPWFTFKTGASFSVDFTVPDDKMEPLSSCKDNFLSDASGELENIIFTAEDGIRFVSKKARKLEELLQKETEEAEKLVSTLPMNRPKSARK